MAHRQQCLRVTFAIATKMRVVTRHHRNRPEFAHDDAGNELTGHFLGDGNGEVHQANLLYAECGQSLESLGQCHQKSRRPTRGQNLGRVRIEGHDGRRCPTLSGGGD